MPLLASKEWKYCSKCKKDISKSYSASYIHGSKSMFYPLCNICTKKWNKVLKKTAIAFLKESNG